MKTTPLAATAIRVEIVSSARNPADSLAQLPMSEAPKITTARTAKAAHASARLGLSERTKYAMAMKSPGTMPALITTESHP
jgi:hypothetical protein